MKPSFISKNIFALPGNLFKPLNNIQGVFESCADILITSYWLHVELGKIFTKLYVKK
jgi:hypothetical protein